MIACMPHPYSNPLFFIMYLINFSIIGTRNEIFQLPDRCFSFLDL